MDNEKIIELIKEGKAEPVSRLSNSKTVYRVELDGKIFYPVYSRGKIEKMIRDFTPFRVGDFVAWTISSGRRFRGKIVAEIPPGQRIDDILYKFKQYNVRPVTGLSPRGQVSYLVSVKSGDTFTLYWPPLSKLREVNR